MPSFHRMFVSARKKKPERFHFRHLKYVCCRNKLLSRGENTLASYFDNGYLMPISSGMNLPLALVNIVTVKTKKEKKRWLSFHLFN